MTLFAHRLATAGHACLVIDLYGTGDSQGGFGDGRLAIWLDDLARAVDWLLARDLRAINLLGIRFGACLAARLAAESATDFSRLLMWQPVIRGSNFMTQFLRLKMVADMVDASSQVTTKQLREMSEAGERIEVAGYDIDPELLASVDSFDMLQEKPPASADVSVFEVTPSPTPRHSLDCRKLAEQWSDAGASIDTFLVGGHQFWSSTEIVVVPELLDATLGRIQLGR